MVEAPGNTAVKCGSGTLKLAGASCGASAVVGIDPKGIDDVWTVLSSREADKDGYMHCWFLWAHRLQRGRRWSHRRFEV